MRKSRSTSGVRPLHAGIAVAATAVAAVAGIATPAYAVDVAVTTTPTQAPTLGGQVITFTGTNVLNGITTPGARFVLSTATCPTTYDGASGGTAAPIVTKSDANSGTVTTPALVAGTWKLCLYANATTGAIAGHATTNTTVVASGTLATPGPTTGGTATLRSTGTFTAITGTMGVTFTAAATTCPDRYTPTAAGSTIIASTAVKSGNDAATITVPNTLVQGTNYQACLYNGTVAATSTLVARAANVYAVMPAINISPKNGPAGGNYTMTISTPTASITNATPKVSFTAGSCPTAYNGTSSDPFAGTVTKISNSKVAVAVPVGVTTTEPSATFNVCLYNGTLGALLGAPGVLTIAPALGFNTVTVSVNGAAFAPTGSGPAQGGTLVEIDGISGLPTQASVDAGATLTASFGDSELTSVTVTSADSISGYTTPHAAGAEELTITTAAGSKTTDTPIFTFSYGITVAPNTAAYNSPAVTLDILGSGFDALDFDAAAEAGSGAAPGNGVGVFLVNNGWFAAADTANSVVAAGLVSQCMDVTRISDTELICTLNLAMTSDPTTGYYAAGPVPRGVYNVAVVNDSNAAALAVDADISRISSGSVFTVADY